MGGCGRFAADDSKIRPDPGTVSAEMSVNFASNIDAQTFNLGSNQRRSWKEQILGWFGYGMMAVLAVSMSTALFFFTFTRGSLLVRSALGWIHHESAHIYPLYSNMRLIRLVDHQPMIAAILLFQYNRLVSIITERLHRLDLHNRQVLITSCAFGNMMPRVVQASVQSGASTVVVTDLVQNELDHARRKIGTDTGPVYYVRENATSLRLADGEVSANILFFLLHELPHPQKVPAIHEAIRVLSPGGKLFLADFHQPNVWVLRALGWVYFKVFEPYGLALWNTHDPILHLSAMPGITCERHTVFFGNFQVIVATKA